MTLFLVTLNIGCAYFGFKWAMDAFSKNQNFWGWANLVASAWNAAALLNMIF